MRKDNHVHHSIVNGDMSDDIVSAVSSVRYQDNVGFQVVWTGDAVGTFAVETSDNYSVDAGGNVSNAGDWIALTFDPVLAAAAGVAGKFRIDVNQTGTLWVRLTYTSASGTGTLNVYTTVKVV